MFSPAGNMFSIVESMFRGSEFMFSGRESQSRCKKSMFAGMGCMFSTTEFMFSAAEFMFRREEFMFRSGENGRFSAQFISQSVHGQCGKTPPAFPLLRTSSDQPCLKLPTQNSGEPKIAMAHVARRQPGRAAVKRLSIRSKLRALPGRGRRPSHRLIPRLARDFRSARDRGWRR